MALFKVSNVAITGMEITLPEREESNEQVACIPEKERALFIKTTGIRTRRIAAEGETAADLCFSAAEKLLRKLNWSTDSVDVLVFVTQTPDYLIPGSSMHLQHRLGLPKSTMTVDINQGCAAYPYGLSVISSLLAGGHLKRGLLLVGDTLSKHLSMQDKSTWPIFSDAGSATALEFREGEEMVFNLQTDGSGFRVINTPHGGSRQPFGKASLDDQEISPGVVRKPIHMGMEGLDVFQFASREVPENIHDLLQFAAISAEEVDAFVFHQANKLLNETIRRKLKIPAEKVPYSIDKYGNTSCATIPVTLMSEYRGKGGNVVLSGFGVGLSWGSVVVKLSAI